MLQRIFAGLNGGFAAKNLSGDIWGGLASMLVALPAAIAFGVTTNNFCCRKAC